MNIIIIKKFPNSPLVSLGSTSTAVAGGKY